MSTNASEENQPVAGVAQSAEETQPPGGVTRSAEEIQPPAGETRSLASKLDLWSHVGLIVSLLAGLVVILQLLAISEWNQQTAMAILQQTGSGGVLTAALLAVLPSAIGMSLVFFGARVPYSIVRHQRKFTPWDGVQCLLIVVLLILTSATLYFIYLVIGIGLAIRFGVNDRTLPTTGLNSNKRFFISVIVVPTAVSLLLGATPWMPREVVTFKDPSAPALVGFVLKIDSDQAAILEDDPRAVRYLQASTIKTRRLCGERLWLGTNPISLNKPSPYAKCPDASKKPTTPSPSNSPTVSPATSKKPAGSAQPSSPPSR